MAGMLLIVSRAEPARYTYLKHVFGEAAEVIVDRRAQERRKPRHERAGSERRRIERRQRDTTKDLESSGWALVRR
ncbi:MAG: hypothetical protein DME15_06330 [Candidatus Rokuibacteriota bacterium]|nr:MAG: hypothetical protein DME15_06330 [Candidatus Rokubacteria bacterium]